LETWQITHLPKKFYIPFHLQDPAPGYRVRLQPVHGSRLVGGVDPGQGGIEESLKIVQNNPRFSKKVVAKNSPFFATTFWLQNWLQTGCKKNIEINKVAWL
jgi:hypothetical protein